LVVDPYQALDPIERQERARTAAHASWKNEKDKSGRTAPARQALRDRFAREVDPDEVLPPAVRADRARHAELEHMSRMRLARATAQRRKRQEREAEAKQQQTKDVA
jgi:hypothetical protein